MRIEHSSAPRLLSSTDLRKGQVYERVSTDEARFYIKTDEAFLVNLISGIQMGLDHYVHAKFIHHPVTTLVLG